MIYKCRMGLGGNFSSHQDSLSQLPLNSLTNGIKIEKIIGNGEGLPIKITVTWTFKRNQQYYVI